MKNAIALLLSFYSFVSVAQVQGNVVIEWKDNGKFSSENSSYTMPQFASDNFYFDDTKMQIFYRLSIPATSDAQESSLQITNITYETISNQQLGNLSSANLPTTAKASISNHLARDYRFVALSLSPIIKEGGAVRRIKSFTYSFNYGAAARSAIQNTAMSANSISNSVLASGDWYRFYVEKSGVYRISKSFLQSLGMNTDNVDPRRLKIFGHGGRMVPLSNSVAYPLDPLENPITVVGENDGVFNNEDYILFYAEGVDNWSRENGTHNNLYSSRSYYYVTASGDMGSRITPMNPLTNNPATMTVTAFDDYQYHEVDKENIVRLGRQWFGENFTIESEQLFTFNVPNVVASVPVKIDVVAAAVSYTATSFAVKANGQAVGSVDIQALSAGAPTIHAYERKMTGSFTTTTDEIKIGLNYNNNGVPNSVGYLDYIALKAKRNLQGIGKQFRFQVDDAATNIGIIQYNVANASGINLIWDITDIHNVTKAEVNGQSVFSFKAVLGEVRNYIAIDPNDYYAPLKESQSRVANQNLKGTILKNNQGLIEDVDYLIITPSALNSQAERLANFHRSNSGLNVRVVNLENIYQEFSSGKQDVGAIRNFVKYVYNNASSPSRRVKYLNLFGDASFDYKDRIPNNTNIVPIFQSFNPAANDNLSNNPTMFSSFTTFASDDFYTITGDNSGILAMTGSDALDIAVGRMLVSSVSQAAEMVSKVIDYHDSKSYGKWRNNFVLMSDDVDRESDASLQFRLDNLGEVLAAQKPFINVKKIHSDSYVQESSAGGQRYPAVRQEFINSFEQGALVFNYMGHGGEDGLASERLFEKSDAQNLSNQYKYPLFITVTCEFTRFDNPYRPTAGEYTYWNPRGGAVALITTTREIGVGTALDFNDRLSGILFSYGNDTYPTIAEALRLSKMGTSSNEVTRMVFCIGDPALKLAIPKPKVILTKINDNPVATATDVLQSLSYVKLAGQVTDENGTLLTGYNGDLAVNIYDKRIDRVTLGNDGYTPTGGTLLIMNFKTLGETIFRGNASVANGQFEFGFVVPRDIRIPVGEGRVSFYAKKDTPLQDQTGYNTAIKVGGVNLNAPVDNTPPTVKLYMNDTSFVSGGITNDSPIFLAFLFDENGMNTASGIGHDMVAILDGDETNPYILNDYYETTLDDYKNGKTRYPFRNLAVGLHIILFKAWDVYNNLVTAEIQFVVVGDDELKLENVLNYPNPFVSYTEFWFSHNRPFEPLEVQVQVMTVTGKIVWTKNQVVTTTGFLSREITWDGRDDFGDRIGKGVYIYKLTVKSTLTNKKTEKFEKLVIL